MTLPLHVRFVCALESFMFIAMGLRDIISPGVGLSFAQDIGEDKMAMMWGSKLTKKGELVGTPIEGVQLVLAREHGLLFVFVGLFSLGVVFSHMSEGTFLRRNLLALLGLMRLGLALHYYVHLDILKENLLDTTVFWLTVVEMAIIGLFYLADALLRVRKVKKPAQSLTYSKKK